MYRYPLMILFMLCCLLSQAQFIVRGIVKNEKQLPLSFVSVLLTANGRTVASASSDEKGSFSLQLQADTVYTIQCSLVGYQVFTKQFRYPDTAFLSAIALTEEGGTLGNVTVTARKPMVTRRADRFIINIENSFLANGNSALDVLQRAPGLSVDYNGTIKIMGAQGVTVMINDMIQRMSGDELAAYLRTLRSEDISRIEVIPTPPAEYEAAGSGGIVHIILKQARRDGINGVVSGQYRQIGEHGFTWLSGSVDYKRDKLYLVGGVSVNRELTNTMATSENRFPDKSFFTTSVARTNLNRRQSYRLGMVYDISARQSLSVYSSYNHVWMDHHFYSDVVQGDASGITNGTNTTSWLRNPSQGSVNAVYTRKTDTIGSVFKIITEYTNGKRNDVNLFAAASADHSLDALRNTYTDHGTDIFTIQADHMQVLKKNAALRAGIKYAGIGRENNVAIDDIINGNIVPNPGSNRFRYREQLLMGYLAAEKTFGSTSVKLGLRGEQTFSKGHSITGASSFTRQYFNLFPSLFISHVLGEEKGGTMYFSYARRLSRPGFNELNPYRMQLNSVSVIIGNPDLQPEFTHKFDLGYQSAKGFSASLFYMLSTGVIRQLAVPDGNIIEQQYRNLDHHFTYGLDLEAPFTVVKGWMISNSLNFLYAGFSTQVFNNRSAALSFRQIQSVQIPKVMDIDLVADYRSPYVNGNSHVSDYFYMDIGLTRRILNNKGRVRLLVSDIFNTAREQENTDYQGAYSAFYQKRQTRFIGISFNYSFSLGKKFNKKNIDQGSSEEKSRLGS